MQVEFNRDHTELVGKIADRAAGMIRLTKSTRMSLMMDISAANGVNGNDPIDLDRLLAADDFNVAHDVFGISRHMDRETGKIGDFFSPRFTARVSA